MIIDIHTHVPPEADWPAFLAENRANSITFTVVSHLGQAGWQQFPDSQAVREANDNAKKFVDFAKGTALWFVYLNPQNPDWPEELERGIRNGARGVKIWVSIKEPETGSLDNACALCQAVGKTGLPVIAHTWNRTDANLPGELNSGDFAELARRCPETTLIAAHAGANIAHACGLYTNLPNVMVDICGGYPAAGMAETLVGELGADRVLYGSDAIGRSVASQIAKVEFAELDAETKEKILWSNAARILEITDGEVKAANTTLASFPPLEEETLPNLAEDHFCFCGRWPFAANLEVSPATLDKLLAESGCQKAFAASADAVFANNVIAANRDFAETVKTCPRIVSLATLTPFAPNWKPQLEEAIAQFTGGIVHPYLHNWQLDDPAYEEFWQICADNQFPIWITACIADYRLRHRSLACRNVAAGELTSFAQSAPANRYVFQGVPAPQIATFLQTQNRPDFRFEISRCTDTSSPNITLATTLRNHGTKQLVHGSEFPFRNINTVKWTASRLCGKS